MNIDSLISSAAANSQQLTAADYNKLNSVPPEQRKQLEAQMMMQKESELVTLITNLMKQMHETRMSVIRNIG
jgi:hypothetical protein